MRRLVLLVAVALLLSGCPRRVDFGLRGPIDDPMEILAVIAERQGRVEGLVGEGRLVIDTDEADGTLRVAIEAIEPAFVYLESVDLLGTPRGTFATDGSRFQFYDPGTHTFYRGAATRETIGRFLPVALPPEELSGALLGEVPLLFDAEEARLQIDEAVGTYVLLLRRGSVRQRVEVATRDLRLISVQTRGREAIDVEYSDHQEILPDLPFSKDFVLRAQGAQVRVRYTDLQLNPPLDVGHFLLEPPPGAEVVPL